MYVDRVCGELIFTFQGVMAATEGCFTVRSKYKRTLALYPVCFVDSQC